MEKKEKLVGGRKREEEKSGIMGKEKFVEGRKREEEKRRMME